MLSSFLSSPLSLPHSRLPCPFHKKKKKKGLEIPSLGPLFISGSSTWIEKDKLRSNNFDPALLQQLFVPPLSLKF